MSYNNSYMIYNCPPDFETTPEKAQKLTSILKKFYKYLGGYRQTITIWDSSPRTSKKLKAYKMVYSRLDTGACDWRKYEAARETARSHVEVSWGSDKHSHIEHHANKKPKRVWTKEDKQEEQAQKEITKEDNVIGRIFTRVGDRHYPSEAMFFLDYKRSRYKVLVLTYDPKGIKLTEDYRFKKEVWEMIEEGQWKENDLAFLVKCGSPKQEMLAKVRDYIAVYTRGMEALEKVQEKSLAEVKEEVVERVKEGENRASFKEDVNEDKN